MTSEVTICNAALSNLGDSATVASIDPPEGSAQADHCAQFYPIARDTLIEVHPWNFASRRGLLAQLTNPTTTWRYCYAAPNNMLKAWAVIAVDATDDQVSAAGYVPQPYAIETLDDGTVVVLTNQEHAVLRFTVRVTDTTKFSPLFVETLTWLLASKLAGPVLKGDSGRKAAAYCLQQVAVWLGEAKTSDSNQRHQPPRDTQHRVSWVSAR